MSKKDNILVVATTRKENIERSVKRLGRFDIKIEMYFPDAKERKEINSLLGISVKNRKKFFENNPYYGWCKRRFN